MTATRHHHNQQRPEMQQILKELGIRPSEAPEQEQHQQRDPRCNHQRLRAVQLTFCYYCNCAT